MAKGQGHGFFCFCKKCTGQSKSKPKPVRLGGSSSYPTRDTGGTPAKRQTQKNHGTNRKGGYKKR